MALSPSFALALLKPEIASGAYNFALPELDTPVRSARADPSDASGDEEPLRSAISGVSAVEAALLFPDGQVLAGVFTRLASAGLRVRERRVVQLSKAQARALFSHERERLKDEKLFCAFVGSFTRGVSLALLLEYPSSATADEAVARCKQLVGKDDPVAARQDALSASLPHDEWPLRALCGLDAVRSGILCSATLDCFFRERVLLFAPQHEPLERAAVVLLPSFLDALPDGRALLVSRLNAGGVLVSRVVDSLRFASLAVLETEQHASTDAQHREEFAAWLRENVAANGRQSVLLELEALGLTAKLREILGPASLDDAQRYFPDSVRAQLPRSLAPAVAHVRSAENSASCLDTGIFVTFEAPAIAALLRSSPNEDEEEEVIERTFAIIKPGAASDAAAVREIHAALRAFGFAVEQQRRLRLSRSQAAAFYGEHRGKPFFERLVKFMTSGELVALQLARRRAVRTWRGLMGPTNALAARETHPWTLRARFGVDGTRNATHGSDAASSARRELQFFFGGGLRAFAGGAAAAPGAKSVAQRALPAPYAPSLTLEKVLAKALDEMLATGPQDACAWLGNWLLAYARSQQDQPPPPVQQGDEPTSKRVAHYAKPAKKPTIAPADASDLAEKLLVGSARTLVALAFASDVSAEQRRAVEAAVRSLAAPRFALVDVAPIDRLLLVEGQQSDDAWAAHLRKRGLVSELPLDCLSACDGDQRLRDAIGPVVGLCFAPAGELLDRVCALALAQGFAVLDAAADGASQHQHQQQVDGVARVLRRANGTTSAAKLLVCGFPCAPDAVRAFIDAAGVPRFAILPPASSPGLEGLAGVLGAHPEIAQVDPAALTPSRIPSLLFGKRLSFAVGDARELDAGRLRRVLAALGFSVLDLRAQQLVESGERSSDDVASDLVARVRGTATPRCLVLGAPEDAAFFGAVEKLVGSSAVDRIAVLKRVARQPPPSRAAKRSDDDADDFSDTEEDDERQRQQQLRAALAPHLEHLLTTFSSTPRGAGHAGESAAVAVMLAFLSVDRVYEQLRRELQPPVLGVVGHAHTFYARALQASARRHAAVTLSARWWSSGDLAPVAQLQRFVARTPFTAYLVDGFPRATADGAAPYVAQQLLALERAALPMRALVHFASSMDVLAERRPEGVTRRMLEDAQDALEDATTELLERFGRSGALLSVTCEREVADAEEALDAALAGAGVVRW